MTHTSYSTPWVTAAKTPPGAQTRLFCFPYAGGGASVYRGWQAGLPARVAVHPVQYPGRESRISESPAHSLEALAEGAAEAIRPMLDRPFAFFGHSLGARIAFETARILRGRWGISPGCLMVSASRAPHLPEPRPIHHLPDDAFTDELRRFSGTPEAILANPDFMAFYLPILRADFQADETYRHEIQPPLECPIAAFGGDSDPEAETEEISQWAKHTTGTFSLEMFAGDHFFLNPQQPALLKSIGEHLSCRDFGRLSPTEIRAAH